MTWWVRAIADGIGAALYFWLAWLTLKTGMPAGNPKMNPRRSERPFQFWLVFLLFAFFGAYYASRAAGL